MSQITAFDAATTQYVSGLGDAADKALRVAIASLLQGLGANNPIRADTAAASELNSLANGGVALCAPVISNVQNDGQGGGRSSVVASLGLGSAAYTSSSYLMGWLLCARDGTHFETYVSGTSTTTAPKGRAADFVWIIDPATQAVIVDVAAASGAPVCAKQQLLVWNATGVSLPSSGNSVNLYFSSP